MFHEILSLVASSVSVIKSITTVEDALITPLVDFIGVIGIAITRSLLL
jgi:hypothetical protein